MPDFEESIAHTAFGYVHGERAKTYGHPRFDFSAIAKVWTGLLQDVLKDDAKLDPYRVAILMTGLKLCRLVKSPEHKDSRIDTIGYMLTMERLDEVEESPPVDWNTVTLKPGEPYEFPKPVHYTSIRDAEREIDKLLGRETAEHSQELDKIQTDEWDASPVRAVLRGFKPVSEIEWQYGDILEAWKCLPKRSWVYDNGTWTTVGANTAAHNNCAFTTSYLREHNAPLIVTTGTYKGLLLFKDGVGYVPE